MGQQTSRGYKLDQTGQETQDLLDKIEGVEAHAQVNIIESVKVNGTAMTPDANKAVDVEVPTALSELSDDATHRLVTDAEKDSWNDKQAAINRVNVTVSSGSGTPSGTASMSGNTLNLSFTNLKGDQGETGPAGPTGATGATPAFSIGEVTTRPEGWPATATITGTAAAPVLNLGIPAGATGPQGPQGNTGPTGATGATGAQGPTGPQGPQGDTGEAGADGNGIESAVLNSDYTLSLSFTDGTSYTTPPIRGAQGATGATGATGPQGETGPQGPAGSTGAAAGFGTPTASINSGTGTPSVSVSASGPDTAKVFNFTFSNIKGDTGATGPQGPAGSDADVTAENITAALGYTPASSSALAGKQDTISDLSTIRSGAALGSTSVQPADIEDMVEAEPIGSIIPPVNPSEFATKEELSQLGQEVDEKFHAPNTEVGGLDTGYYNTYAATLPTNRNTKNDCKSAKFSVTPGDKLKLYGEAGRNDYYRFYAFYDANGDRIDRYSSSGTYRDTPLDVTVPANAVTMVVNLVNYASATDKVIIQGEEYSLQDFDQRIEQTSEDVAGLSEDVSAVETKTEELESSIIEGASVSLKGLSSSNLVLNEAIELAQDGDELEIEVKDIGSVDYTGYPFSSSGVQSNSYYAIMLSRTKYGIRATDGTWLCEAVSVPHSSVNHYVKIVFDDGKVYSYVDGNLVHTYNGQKTIRVASFGNGGNGTYGYWTGTIVSIKHNGEYIDLYKQVNNDTILAFQYNFVRWEDMAGLDVLPIGILKYDSINHIFDYFSRYGKTDKYFSFRVRLNEDNTDPVYLKEWRLSEGKVWRYEDGNFTEIAKTIYDAENEMAMHLAGTADYTGGIHGDERIDVSPLSFVRFYADGKLITSEDMQEDFEIECASFCYMQLSTLHQTSETSGGFVTGHPIIAYHYKRNTFEDCASKLENVIKFASEQSVTQYHAGMMCVGKGVGLYAILPGMVETPELSGTNSYYDADDKSASRVDLWNPTTGFRCYVTGDVLQGFDNATELNQFQIWDRTTDSKYYRRYVRSADYAKVFVTNSFIRNEQTIKFY